MPITGGVKTNITYNMSYALWDAAIAAGATMDELYRMEMGLYPPSLLAKIIAWRRGTIAIENHTEAEKAKAIKNKK